MISTQSIPPRLVYEVLSPQIAHLSCLLLPKLSTLVDCFLGWVVQHLQAFFMSLAAHCHHIIVVPLLLSDCRCPNAILKMLQSSPLTLPLLAVAAASSPSPSPSPLLLLSSPLPSLPSLLPSLWQCCFVIVVIIKLFGGQSEELDQTTPPQNIS